MKATGENDFRLLDILKDDVFVDFFNTFLNLPVFGQTPLYFLSGKTWFLCPEIGQRVNKRGFLKWLTAHRLPSFKDTELFRCYQLCKELLDFSLHHSKDVLNWSAADQWLLKRSIGGVNGMRRFCTFIQSSRGEELVAFCVRVSSLLQMNAGDPCQRHRYLALLTVIKVVHLRQGSSVMAVCHIQTEALMNILSSDQPDNGIQPILAQMYTNALQRLQHYWLPQYLQCCKTSIRRVEECSSIAQQYSAMTSHASAGMEERSVPLDIDSGQEVKEGWRVGSHTLTYCSKHSKRVLWMDSQAPRSTAMTTQETESLDGPCSCQWLPLEGAADQEGCNNIVHGPMEWQDVAIGAGTKKPDLESKRSSKQTTEGDMLSSSTASPWEEKDQVREVVIPHICVETPVFYRPYNLTAPASPPELHCYKYMKLALSADSLAGGPFHTFLKDRGLLAQMHWLALWQELELFLSLALRAQGDDSFYGQRQAVARGIIQTYLSESTETEVHLEAATSFHLCRLLPSGDVIPWIYRAKHEICQALCVSYDAFLDEEDKEFCSHVFESEDENCGQILTSSGHITAEQQRRCMREALALCQACCDHGDDTAMLSEESWAQMALEDVGRGGSVHIQYTKCDPFNLPFELLAMRYPKLAAEQLSVNYQLYYRRTPSSGEFTKIVSGGAYVKRKPTMLKRGNSLMRRPSMRPRTLADVFRTPVCLDYFKRFLRANNAYGALFYMQEVEKLKALDRPKSQRTKIRAIVDKFFLRDDPMDYLQCKADIISQVSQMQPVTCEVLYTIQDLVSKSLEGTWFNEYQDTFPPYQAMPMDTSQRAAHLKNKLRNVWIVFSRLIKSVCRFRHAMKDPSMRSAFELYLRHYYVHFSDACSSTLSNHHPESPKHPKEEGDVPTKVRMINQKVITVDFLMNDLSFYLECERFRSLADAGTIMASAGMYGENYHAILHQKADMIIRLFLKSEISPKLRINIAESQRNSILQQLSIGKVDRGLFHPAIMSIFPNLIYCWRKFCFQKVTKTLCDYKSIKKQEVSSSPDYVDPLNEWYRKVKTVTSATENHTTLRFTIHHGLKLILPQIRLDLKVILDNLPTKVPSRQRSNSSFTFQSGFKSEPQLGSQLPQPDGGITSDETSPPGL